MRRFAPRASSSSNRGLTLVELLVTLVILSILAAAALPYAEVTVRRFVRGLAKKIATRGVHSALERPLARTADAR